MQYLLTAGEWGEVLAERQAARQLPGGNIGACLQILGDEAKRLAMTMQGIGSGEPRAHGCIHVKPLPDNIGPRYCDYCPAKGFCPLPKNWSK